MVQHKLWRELFSYCFFHIHFANSSLDLVWRCYSSICWGWGRTYQRFEDLISSKAFQEAVAAQQEIGTDLEQVEVLQKKFDDFKGDLKANEVRLQEMNQIGMFVTGISRKASRATLIDYHRPWIANHYAVCSLGTARFYVTHLGNLRKLTFWKLLIYCLLNYAFAL